MDAYKEMLARQAAWSRATFGPGSRLKGCIEHIQKELKELEDDGGHPSEAVDIVILAHDLLLRAIKERCPELTMDIVAQEAAGMVRDKLAKNELRVWPNWRDFDQDTAIEHVRGIHD